jgi:hypothetical protein
MLLQPLYPRQATPVIVFAYAAAIAEKAEYKPTLISNFMLLLQIAVI